MNILEYFSSISFRTHVYEMGFYIICPITTCQAYIYDHPCGPISLGNIIDKAHKHYREKHDGQ